MALTPNTNVTSLASASSLFAAQDQLERSIARISSGLRITRAADDAAGLGVAENLQSTSRSVKMALRNTNDGISVMQTVEGAANEIGNILRRMRVLAIQSASEPLANAERVYVNDEFSALGEEIDRIAEVTEFNGLALANANQSLAVQVGIDGTTDSRISIALFNLRADGANLSVDTGSIDLLTAGNAQTAITGIDTAIDFINEVRSGFGATQNRLETAYRTADNYYVNLVDAESRVRDADFAYESAQMSKAQLLQNSGVAVLAQANSMYASAAQLITS